MLIKTENQSFSLVFHMSKPPYTEDLHRLHHYMVLWLVQGEAVISNAYFERAMLKPCFFSLNVWLCV